eukprot:scaffold9090_cov138-Isochrysis_galbana.AAC.3
MCVMVSDRRGFAAGHTCAYNRPRTHVQHKQGTRGDTTSLQLTWSLTCQDMWAPEQHWSWSLTEYHGLRPKKGVYYY